MRYKSFFYAVAVLIGMIVGVGIFGIPYAVAQAGFVAGLFYLVILTVAILIVHLLYGEIVLRTPSDHGLVGYADKYLGASGKRVMGAVIIFEFYGGLLAYLIAGGKFLNVALGRFLGGSDMIWSLVFFSVGALIVFAGLKTVAPSEFFMTIFMVAIAAIIFIKGAPIIKITNLPAVNWAKFFLPYGIILFSLTGGAAIPEVRQILKNQEHNFKKIIVLGTLIPAVVYFFFTLGIVGVTGSATSKDAISGLTPHFGAWVVMLGAIFGFLAVITSYLVVATNLRRVFRQDYKINKFLAWALVCFVPLILYWLGINDFIYVIGLVGALAVGAEGIMTILIYWRAKKLGLRQPEYSLKISRLVLGGLTLIFLLGVVYQLIYIVR